ncbi:MAG: hypothetical protein ACFFE6_05975 [Candidatus Thorarchaeota archaeon]
MVKYQVFTPRADEFISLLEQQKNIKWKKVWYISGKTIGVYLIEEFPLTLSAESAMLSVIIEHDQDEEYCQIWIEPFGTGMVSPDKRMKELVRGIGNIAMKNEWEFERIVIKYGGNTCPHCNATYKYKQDPESRTAIRTCQNCGMEFDSDVPLDVEKEWGDVRVRRSLCPYCKAAYFYKKKHIQDDGIVVCQNCGESFVLQIDDWTKYSYDWYQDED